LDEWKKGGLRYTLLKQRVPDFLAPVELRCFFVAVRKFGGLLRLTGLITLFQREYVIAATDNGVSVLLLKRPGVFSATIAGSTYEASLDEAKAKWKSGGLILDGVEYRPIAFHDEDALDVARLLHAEGSGWRTAPVRPRD
jgi:hypothetical protein